MSKYIQNQDSIKQYVFERVAEAAIRKDKLSVDKLYDEVFSTFGDKAVGRTTMWKMQKEARESIKGAVPDPSFEHGTVSGAASDSRRARPFPSGPYGRRQAVLVVQVRSDVLIARRTRPRPGRSVPLRSTVSGVAAPAPTFRGWGVRRSVR